MFEAHIAGSITEAQHGDFADVALEGVCLLVDRSVVDFSGHPCVGVAVVGEDPHQFVVIGEVSEQSGFDVREVTNYYHLAFGCKERAAKDAGAKVAVGVRLVGVTLEVLHVQLGSASEPAGEGAGVAG